MTDLRAYPIEVQVDVAGGSGSSYYGYTIANGLSPSGRPPRPPASHETATRRLSSRQFSKVDSQRGQDEGGSGGCALMTPCFRRPRTLRVGGAGGGGRS
eukprot:scaffold184588_cov33-Tisochrysis_lutea.AAC.1